MATRVVYKGCNNNVGTKEIEHVVVKTYVFSYTFIRSMNSLFDLSRSLDGRIYSLYTFTLVSRYVRLCAGCKSPENE